MLYIVSEIEELLKTLPTLSKFSLITNFVLELYSKIKGISIVFPDSIKVSNSNGL